MAARVTPLFVRVLLPLCGVGARPGTQDPFCEVFSSLVDKILVPDFVLTELLIDEEHASLGELVALTRDLCSLVRISSCRCGPWKLSSHEQTAHRPREARRQGRSWLGPSSQVGRQGQRAFRIGAMALDEDQQPAPKKSRRVHYDRYHIWVHEKSQVSRPELENALKKGLEDSAHSADETVIVRPSRGKQTVYVIAPKGVGPPSPQDRATKRLKAAIEQARKAGLDPRPFIDSAR